MSNLSAKDGTLIAGFGVAIIVLIGSISFTVVKDITAEAHARTTARPPAATAALPPTHATSSIVVVSAPAVIPPFTPTAPTPPQSATATVRATTKTYIEVTESCAAHYQGECLHVRSGPGTNYPIIAKLRTGIVLRVADTPIVDTTGMSWYKVMFDEWLRYPERLKGTWYVAADFVSVLQEPIEADFTPGISPTTTKTIFVNRTKQQLYAYDGDTLVMTATTSTGLDSTPTPRGVFTIYKKTPSRYMQGPLPGVDSTQVYDLPGVPWNLYFTNEGAVIHGAYWHTAFGTPYSHGCVNLSLADAKKIYDWAPVGTVVTVRD